MARTAKEMRDMVEEYIRATGAAYEDQTEAVRKKGGMVDWQFHVGEKVVVNKRTDRADRIHINVNMRFAPKDAMLLVPTNPSFSKAIMETSEICTVCKVGHQWLKDNKGIAGLAIYSHVDEEALDRRTFHDEWDNVARVTGHVQRILSANMGRPPHEPSDGASVKSMYG